MGAEITCTLKTREEVGVVNNETSMTIISVSVILMHNSEIIKF